MDISAYAGPLVVTLAYVALYYAFVIYVAWVKVDLQRRYEARGERFDRYFGDDREMLAADRMQLNTLEQMPPFLVLLWLHAVFVGSFGATVAGGVYVVARAAYPFLVGGRLGRGIPGRILVSTVPGYLVIAYFIGALSWTLVAG